jgi:hypothetical protein
MGGIEVMLGIEQDMSKMFITGTESVTCISNENKALYRELMRLFKIAASAIQKAWTEHINGLKIKRYLESHDWPSTVVSICLHKELKQMNLTKPFQGICTIMVEILNVLLEIRNLLNNLWNEHHGFLRIHKGLH